MFDNQNNHSGDNGRSDVLTAKDRLIAGGLIIFIAFLFFFVFYLVVKMS